MLNLFVCGSGTFHREEDEAEPWSNSPCSSPRKPRRKNHNKDSKNPYSTRGLDKFSELLADLEEKRNKIYSQVGSQDISLVRFMYSNSNDWVPIVVKSKNNMEDKTQIRDIVKDKHDTPAKSSVDSKELKQPILESNERPKKKRFFWNLKLDRWRRPSYYLPAIVILILLLLAVFGRSFAILCTSLGWYLVPALKMSPNTKRSTKKKTYARELSENKMVVSEKAKEYTRSSSGLVDQGKSPQQHGHRKSW
ncbi:hypothetical protein F2P56_025614 [Juglans regia]|uniref:ZCF37 n=2 Tax=Juglans regia TaxID=51240 RepID=A0A833UKF0_JUGRE|nr:uncharacterized protein LOC109012379 [Juglans regia]KAF5456103.1 hypothetical protein F2P56_025614 [Juglans regia]